MVVIVDSGGGRRPSLSVVGRRRRSAAMPDGPRGIQTLTCCHVEFRFHGTVPFLLFSGIDIRRRFNFEYLHIV